MQTIPTPLPGLAPVHPGEILREDVLPALKEGKAEVARLLGVTRSTFYKILDGKIAVTANTALRLGKLFGNGAEFWLNLQNQYDLKVAQAQLVDHLASMPTLTAAEGSAAQ